MGQGLGEREADRAPACNRIGKHMQSETEYRAQAAQFVRQAGHAKTAAHRTALLQQAETLRRTAVISAQMEQILGPEDRLTAKTR
jgi:hypothetical protein